MRGRAERVEIMRISVSQLEQGKREFAYELLPEEFDLGEEGIRLAAPLKIDGTAVLKNAEVRVRGALRGSIEADCDRCLRPVPMPIDLSFDAHLVAGGNQDGGQNVELADQDLDYSVFEGEWVDLDELAREQILLARPTRLLCREECRGLCANCGADLNQDQKCGCADAETDPRWGALAALKKS